MRTYIRQRYWFGYWWASICSRDYHYNDSCDLCIAGRWTRVNHAKLFGKK